MSEPITTTQVLSPPLLHVGVTATTVGGARYRLGMPRAEGATPATISAYAIPLGTTRRHIYGGQFECCPCAASAAHREKCVAAATHPPSHGQRHGMPRARAVRGDGTFFR